MPRKAQDHAGEAGDGEPDAQEPRQESRPVHKQPERKEPQTPKYFVDNKSVMMQIDEQHSQSIQNAKVTSLATLIKKRLDIDAVITPGKAGQFDVIADRERIAERGGNWFTRSFGAGYPDLDSVVEQLEKRHRPQV